MYMCYGVCVLKDLGREHKYSYTQGVSKVSRDQCRDRIIIAKML